jgi:hypothetical protein
MAPDLLQVLRYLILHYALILSSTGHVLEMLSYNLIIVLRVKQLTSQKPSWCACWKDHPGLLCPLQVTPTQLSDKCKHLQRLWD